jgi:hypothetical protein
MNLVVFLPFVLFGILWGAMFFPYSAVKLSGPRLFFGEVLYNCFNLIACYWFVEFVCPLGSILVGPTCWEIYQFLHDFIVCYKIGFQNIHTTFLYQLLNFIGCHCNIFFFISNFINFGLLLSLVSLAKGLIFLKLFSKNPVFYLWFIVWYFCFPIY